MPPNARPIIEFEDQHDPLAAMLDSKADTDGLANVNADAEDWTDVKHSERKKRDRILDDGVLIGLMSKSDIQGCKRLFSLVGCLVATGVAIRQLQIYPWQVTGFDTRKFILFVPLYLFYGFQFQAFAFAGQHEFLHRNAFKTKWINDLCLFVVGCFTFELGVHERVMHKQHHTYTNNIYKDPELTSFYTREQLENPGFRNVPLSKVHYFLQFLNVFSTFSHRVGRIVNSAAGIPVDYSGWRWSLGRWTYSDESGIMRQLQRHAWAQLTWYATAAYCASQMPNGFENLLCYWIAPIFVGYPLINYFRNLEHADCEISQEPNCLRNTRSVRSNPIVRFFLWDTNYHAEHHCYPMVPFYNLSKINDHMYGHVIHSERDHFSTQNWAAIAPGGWIDQQARCMKLFEAKTQQRKRE